MTIGYTPSGRFIHKRTYACTWCGKKDLFYWERTHWNNPNDGFRTNFLCAKCAIQLELEVAPWPDPLPPHFPKIIVETLKEEHRRLEVE